ncbi:MAG: hypothetical protein OXH52_11720 [Gammaproteobacteria bacterium]|nr:hypothetical protein [Gammaproteobacteria bacterium]
MVDAVRKPYLTLYRVRCFHSLAEELLQYRDARTVDLPPQVGLEPTLIYTDVQRLNPAPNPPENAPSVAVLDTGIVAGHPLLATAVGDSQSFLAGVPAADDHGHGTFVGAIALYDLGDAEIERYCASFYMVIHSTICGCCREALVRRRHPQ